MFCCHHSDLLIPVISSLVPEYRCNSKPRLVKTWKKLVVSSQLCMPEASKKTKGEISAVVTHVKVRIPAMPSNTSTATAIQAVLVFEAYWARSVCNQDQDTWLVKSSLFALETLDYNHATLVSKKFVDPLILISRSVWGLNQLDVPFKGGWTFPDSVPSVPPWAVQGSLITERLPLLNDSGLPMWTPKNFSSPWIQPKN